MLACLNARVAAFAKRPAARGFACLSVHVKYDLIETTLDDLRAVFEQVGNVWEIRPIQSTQSGRLLGRTVVMFYEGAYWPGASPDEPPTLSPPTSEEIQAVTAVVENAVSRFDRTLVNNAQIDVHRTKSGPSQLHKWYENLQYRGEWAKTQHHKNLFPVNPFFDHKPPEDDYHKGFVAGFKLGLKDGSKNPRK
ncbi:hypothetical protein IWW50_002366 [Coemansia erecta]|nr:hypothetical protein GGF43_003988 [Coemansia sp. RSA 2618]KAJ2826415.1 hypothetical protein IWW50_002366 [Coemansia erecta]